MSDDMLYNHTLAAALNMDARAHKERIAALERLVKDFNDFVKQLDVRYGYGVIREAEKHRLHERAKTLLGQEVK